MDSNFAFLVFLHLIIWETFRSRKGVFSEFLVLWELDKSYILSLQTHSWLEMEEAETYRKIMEEAREYLLSFDEVTEEMIDTHLKLWKEDNPNSLEDLLQGLLNSAISREGMRGIDRNTIKDLRPHLKAFNPPALVQKHKDDWESIFDEIQEEYNPTKPQMNKKEKRNPWVRLSKTIRDSARFLLQFKTYEDFDGFAKRFADDKNLDIRASLPIFIEERIEGLGFTLACDFLKENGYCNYVKPDRWIKRIFTELGISESRDEIQIFKDAVNFSETIGELPFEADKLFWLVGTGNFYRIGEGKIKTKPSEFIEKVKSKYEM